MKGRVLELLEAEKLRATTFYPSDLNQGSDHFMRVLGHMSRAVRAINRAIEALLDVSLDG